jgi:hypothetical protein
MLPPRRTVTKHVWVIARSGDIVPMTIPWSSGSQDVCPVMIGNRTTVVQRRNVFTDEQEARTELNRRRVLEALGSEAT